MRRAILIGDPVDKSISHITHNEIFKKCGLNCVYEKKVVCKERLFEEVKELKKIDYLYLAVTMPLKEVILPFLDERKEEIGSVNTIQIVDGKWIGHNFDGIGALNAIEAFITVKGKTVLVLGAGGAAKAAIYEAKKRGATVYVWNRTKQRAKKVAEEFKVFATDEETRVFDIVIQATCVGMFSNEVPLDLKWISSKSVVLEMICNPMMTLFCQNALKKGAHVIFGYEMFSELSLAQFNMAFHSQLDKEKVKKIIENFFIKK
ncbi:MAG: shikimate dehydrogenase [Chlamydiae bacterium]|nr:shikimate dehydrogenase [Chlamydiota bacterium]